MGQAVPRLMAPPAAKQHIGHLRQRLTRLRRLELHRRRHPRHPSRTRHLRQLRRWLCNRSATRSGNCRVRDPRSVRDSPMFRLKLEHPGDLTAKLTAYGWKPADSATCGSTTIRDLRREKDPATLHGRLPLNLLSRGSLVRVQHGSFSTARSVGDSASERGASFISGRGLTATLTA